MYENGWFLVLGHEYHTRTLIITMISMLIVFIVLFKIYFRNEKIDEKSENK